MHKILNSFCCWATFAVYREKHPSLYGSWQIEVFVTSPVPCVLSSYRLQEKKSAFSVPLTQKRLGARLTGLKPLGFYFLSYEEQLSFDGGRRIGVYILLLQSVLRARQWVLLPQKLFAFRVSTSLQKVRLSFTQIISGIP